jgi:hypothetical protein
MVRSQHIHCEFALCLMVCLSGVVGCGDQTGTDTGPDMMPTQDLILICSNS